MTERWGYNVCSHIKACLVASERIQAMLLERDLLPWHAPAKVLRIDLAELVEGWAVARVRANRGLLGKRSVQEMAAGPFIVKPWVQERSNGIDQTQRGHC